jgi:hypothetical protein
MLNRKLAGESKKCNLEWEAKVEEEDIEVQFAEGYLSDYHHMPPSFSVNL